MTLPLLAVGAVGVVGVATHWTGADHQEMFDALGQGRRRSAPAWCNARLLPSFAYETGDDAPNPIPTKALLRVLGLPVGQARLPMGPAPAGLRGSGPGGAREPRAVAGGVPRPPRPPVPDRWLRRSASPSSAAWARSVATAWSLEQDGRCLLIDCGLMFPDADMHGIDLVLPDFTYLREHADRIVGCVATHGHEDHVGGLSFLLRELSFPIYGSPLTLGLARNRIEEAGLLGRTELVAVADGERRRSAPSTSSSSPSPTRSRTRSPSPCTRPRAWSCTRATSSST